MRLNRRFTESILKDFKWLVILLQSESNLSVVKQRNYPLVCFRFFVFLSIHLFLILQIILSHVSGFFAGVYC